MNIQDAKKICDILNKREYESGAMSLADDLTKQFPGYGWYYEVDDDGCLDGKIYMYQKDNLQYNKLISQINKAKDDLEKLKQEKKKYIMGIK